MALRAGPVRRALATGSCAVLGAVNRSGALEIWARFALVCRYLAVPSCCVRDRRWDLYLAINDVVTSGAISPVGPVAGQPFDVTDYGVTFVLPTARRDRGAVAALATAISAAPSRRSRRQAGTSPSKSSGQTTSFDVPIPWPVPDQGLTMALPATTVALRSRLVTT